jgi:hypothetical protein
LQEFGLLNLQSQVRWQIVHDRHEGPWCKEDESGYLRQHIFGPAVKLTSMFRWRPRNFQDISLRV